MLILGNIVPCILKTRGLIYSWFKLVELQDCVSLIQMNLSLSMKFMGSWSRLLQGVDDPFERIRKKMVQIIFT